MRGPIKVKARAQPVDEPTIERAKREERALPPVKVLEAGAQKFLEYARRSWPRQGKSGDYRQDAFDHNNPQHLFLTLGVVYQAMRDADTD